MTGGKANSSIYSRNNLGDAVGNAEYEAHCRHTEQGSRELLEALRSSHAKRTDLMWQNRVSASTFVVGDSPCHQLRTQYRRIEARQEPYRNYEALIVHREPCPRCGVRADLHAAHGCSRKVLMP